MLMRLAVAATSVVFSVSAVHADDSALVLGKSNYKTYCAVCHGSDAKGGGDVGKMLSVKPADLTKLSDRAGGKFPFSEVYEVVTLGKEAPGHGSSMMPIWGDYFVADALMDRGVNKSDAIAIAAGRILSLTYYIESIQE